MTSTNSIFYVYSSLFIVFSRISLGKQLTGVRTDLNRGLAGATLSQCFFLLTIHNLVEFKIVKIPISVGIIWLCSLMVLLANIMILRGGRGEGIIDNFYRSSNKSRRTTTLIGIAAAFFVASSFLISAQLNRSTSSSTLVKPVLSVQR